MENQNGVVAMSERKIVCLCGSTRFHEDFVEANLQETLKGHIVLSVGVFGHRAEDAHGRSIDVDAHKEALDGLHIDKIDMSHEVLVINTGGHVGSSTRAEVKHARDRGIPIRWFDPDNIPQDA
ncbi:MAG TPA: hypothetical protein EYG03_10170 [Planctomycetes bacterium]|nr:hypothetical protein [Planctomycetota bacterium]